MGQFQEKNLKGKKSTNISSVSRKMALRNRVVVKRNKGSGASIVQMGYHCCQKIGIVDRKGR